jgi:hypothetical protein
MRRAGVIPIAGYRSSTTTVTLYMHRGYDRPIPDASYLAERYATREPGRYILAGPHPLFNWPIYIEVACST